MIKVRLLRKPIISFKGLPIERQNDDFIFDLEDEVEKQVEHFL
jgi:hypothetical protein